MKYSKNEAREIVNSLYDHIMTEAEFNALVKTINKNRPKIKSKKCKSKKRESDPKCE